MIGVLAYSAADWRRAAILFSFPLTLLWLLASHRVHFTRNVLNLHPIVAMCVAYGVISMPAGRSGWQRIAGGAHRASGDQLVSS